MFKICFSLIEEEDISFVQELCLIHQLVRDLPQLPEQLENLANPVTLDDSLEADIISEDQALEVVEMEGKEGVAEIYLDRAVELIVG